MRNLLVAATVLVLMLGDTLLPGRALASTPPGALEIPRVGWPGIQGTESNRYVPLRDEDPAFRQFLRDAGGTWMARENPLTGGVKSVTGYAARVCDPISSLDDAEDAARKFLETYPEIFRLPVEDLRVSYRASVDGRWSVHFAQYVDDWRVVGGRAFVVLSTSGYLVAFGADTYPGAPDVAGNAAGLIDIQEVAALAASEVGFDFAQDTSYSIERVILPMVSNELPSALEFVRAYRVRLSVASPPSCTDSYVDASAGTILWRRNMGGQYTYVGRVRGTVDWPDRCSDSTPLFPFDGMKVRVTNGPTVYCDTAGVFRFADDRQEVTVRLSFDGRWAKMAYADEDDGVPSVDSRILEAGADTAEWYYTLDRDTPSADHERDVFAYINRAHTWFKHYFPADTLLDRQVTCYLNNHQTMPPVEVYPGKAQYSPDPDRIYLSAAGEGGQLSYADIGRVGTVAVHEYGHMLTTHLYAGVDWPDEDVNEGNSHIFSNLVLSDSVVGRGVCTYLSNCLLGYPACTWYESHNARTYPDSLEFEPHSDGEMLSGVYWDAWQELRSSLAGPEAVGAIAAAWHRGRVLLHPLSMPDQVLSMFIGDDDDSLLSNGTPHYAALCVAAENHGFACPQLTSSFVNVATGALAGDGQARCAAWGDYDGDGDADLYVVNWQAQNQLFENDGQGNLTAVAATVLEVSGNGRTAAWGDYDGDGDPDIYLVYDGGCRLFRNESGQAWVDVTTTPIGSLSSGRSGAWVDYDGDGDLDIALTRDYEGGNRLFRNDGAGRFVEAVAGALGSSYSYGQAWGDYDEDGDPDVYICNGGIFNQGRSNKLFRNDGGGQFADVTTANLAMGTRWSVDAAWGDYDNDGDLDLVVANALDFQDVLLRNDGGSFADVTPEVLMKDSGSSLSVAWGDQDNDGDLDLFVGRSLTPSKFLLNVGNGQFTDESSPAIESAEAGNSSGWVDVDMDGDLDLFVACGGGLNKLFENQLEGIDDQWLSVRAVGGSGSAPSVGARVRVWEDGVCQLREIPGGRKGGHEPQEAWFGLGPWGSGETVDSVTVIWPSGAVQRRHGVPSGVLKIGELDPDSCLVALNDSVIACPGGDAVPYRGYKYLEITVTLKDGDGDPLVGVPPDLISVYVSGVSRYANKEIAFCPDSISTIYQATESTDADGQTVIRDSTLGGCGHIYVDSVRVGARTFAVSDSAEIRSPDFTGDGLVNFQDTNRHLQDLNARCAFCGDLTYSGPCVPQPPKGQVNFTDTNKYIPHMITGCDCSNPGKLAVGADLAKNTQSHRGRPRLEVSRVLGDAVPGKAAGSAVVEARVVVEDLSPVSAIHFDLGFEPGRAEFVGAAVEDLYSDYRVWGPFVREDRNVVDLMVSTNKMGEVVSGNVLVATLRFNVSDGTASPVWLESFHTSDAQWNLDTLYSAEPGGNEPVFGLDFVGVAPNPFNPTTEIRFTTGVAGHVELAIYDVSGRRVRSLLSGESPGAGTHSVTWDGRNDSGQETGSGVYFCRISGEEGSSVRRLVLIR